MTVQRQRAKGFTLVELMIVVGIIGILAAIAIPAFTRYIKKSRTAEAVGHLNKIWAGALTYYMSDFSTVGGGQGIALDKQFPEPNGAWEQNPDCCSFPGGKCPGGSSVWASDEVWLALKFALADAHSYIPGYTGSGAGAASHFTAGAFGNLDCSNAIRSQFLRDGYITSNGDVAGQTQPIVYNELE